MLAEAMQPRAIQSVLTVSGVLSGFLFAGFWWSLSREPAFDAGQRHFKLGYLLLLVSMALVAAFGIVIPLSAQGHPGPDVPIDPARRAAVRFDSVNPSSPYNQDLAHYTCCRATAPILADGKLDEADWQAAPKSSPLVDIVTGSPKPKLNPFDMVSVR